MTKPWKEVPGDPNWETQEQEDNRDIFEKALDVTRGAVIGGALVYGLSRLGSRGAKGLAEKFGAKVNKKEYAATAHKHASRVSMVGAAAGGYTNSQPKTKWRRK